MHLHQTMVELGVRKTLISGVSILPTPTVPGAP